MSQTGKFIVLFVFSFSYMASAAPLPKTVKAFCDTGTSILKIHRTRDKKRRLEARELAEKIYVLLSEISDAHGDDRHVTGCEGASLQEIQAASLWAAEVE